jgi:hypothetical protein
MTFRQKYKFTSEQCIMAYQSVLYYISEHSDLIEVHMKSNQIDHIDGIELDLLKNVFIFPDAIDKEELLYETPDIVTHYCKRYLLRSSKFLNELNEK